MATVVGGVATGTVRPEAAAMATAAAAVVLRVAVMEVAGELEVAVPVGGGREAGWG